MLGDRRRQPRVVQEMAPVDVVTRHVTGPATTTQGIGGWLAVKPTAAVGGGMRHIAVHPSHFRFQRQLHAPLVALTMDRRRVADARITSYNVCYTKLLRKSGGQSQNRRYDSGDDANLQRFNDRTSQLL